MRSTKNSLRSRTSESITDGQVHRSRIPESKKRNTRQRTTQPQTIVDFFALALTQSPTHLSRQGSAQRKRWPSSSCRFATRQYTVSRAPGHTLDSRHFAPSPRCGPREDTDKTRHGTAAKRNCSQDLKHAALARTRRSP